MRAGRTLVELAKEIQRQQEAKRDFIAPEGRLQMVHVVEDAAGGPGKQGVELEVPTNGDRTHFGIAPLAHGQVALRTQIPKKYYDRMLGEAPQLLAENVNHWWGASTDRRMIRTLDGKMRAYLSDRYRPMDNFDLAEAVLPRLRDSGAKVESCEITERRMYIKAVVGDRKEEIPPAGVEDWEWGKGHHSIDIAQPGIVISNSEVGYGALQIAPAIHTVQCSNLAVFRQDAMRKYHVGRVQGDGAEELWEVFSDRTKEMSEKAFWNQVADLVTASLSGDLFDRLVARLRKARGQAIDKEAKLDKVVEVVQKRFGLQEGESNGILNRLISGGDLTAYGLHSAITRHSQTVEDYDRATELERIGAQVIELAPKDWTAIACAN